MRPWSCRRPPPAAFAAENHDIAHLALGVTIAAALAVPAAVALLVRADRRDRDTGG